MLSREYLYRSIFICIMKNKYIIYVYIYDMHAKDSQKIKKKTKIPRVTNEGWNSQKQLSGPVEQKKKEKTPVSSSKAFPQNVSSLSADRLCPYPRNVSAVHKVCTGTLLVEINVKVSFIRIRTCTLEVRDYPHICTRFRGTL